MKNIKCILLISTCCFLPNASNAEINLTFDASNISLGNTTLHTHHTPVELKPISVSNSGVKFAATCFLPSCNGNGSGFGDNDYGLGLEEICFSKGYSLTSCTDGKIAKDFCPDSSQYFKTCGCQDEFQYTASSCLTQFPNSILGSEQCSSEGVTYSNSCVCDTAKYPYTTANCTGNEGLSGDICKDINGISYGSTCVCTPTSGACSGYNLDVDTCGGGSNIGESCHNGCTTKWRCKNLCPNEGTLTSCPNGYVCTLEECSSKFYISGCAVNYINYCTQPVTDCEVLGYTKTAEDCTNEALRCPYDSTKLACIEEVCEVGSILYSDKSCSKIVKANKTPIAVVFDNGKRIAVALEDLPKMLPWAPSDGVKVNVATLEDCNGVSNIFSCNTDGAENMKKIISQYGIGTNYAAGYAFYYESVGTNKYDWHLPSYAELRSIYAAKTDINANLQLLGKPILNYSYYWSSNESSADSAWAVNMYGKDYNSRKESSCYVRPVINY